MRNNSNTILADNCIILLFWRDFTMEKQLFSLPAVRSPERAAMEVSAAGRCDAEDPCCGHCFITGAKDRTLQNGRAEIYGLAIFHELLEQPQDLLGDWRASSCCKAAKILRSGCRRTLRFIILVGNVSSVIDNFKVDFSTTNKYYVDDCTDSNQNNYAHYNLFYSRRLVHFAQ